MFAYVAVQPASVRVIDENSKKTLSTGATLGPINEGSTISLYCESGEGKPVPTVEWFKGDQLLEGKDLQRITKVALTKVHEAMHQNLFTSLNILLESLKHAKTKRIELQVVISKNYICLLLCTHIISRSIFLYKRVYKIQIFKYFIFYHISSHFFS